MHNFKLLEGTASHSQTVRALPLQQRVLVTKTALNHESLQVVTSSGTTGRIHPDAVQSCLGGLTPPLIAPQHHQPTYQWFCDLAN
jgi:cation diffusion facilitator CzcD-associated flavoprotein CzcO